MNLLLLNAGRICGWNSRISTRAWSGPGLLVMTLLLMLCCVGCAHSRPQLAPSVTQGPLGNAVLVTLPPGTRIHLADEADAAILRAALVNEVEPGGETLVTRRPLKLATPAYIAERDAREIDLVRMIQGQAVEIPPTR